MQNEILIIGKGAISIKHRLILKKIFKNFKIIQVGSRKFENNYKKYLNKNYILTVIANETSNHIKTLKKTLMYSNYIFVEKPIGDSFFEVKKFYNKYPNKLNKIFVGYNLIFSDIFNRLKVELKSKKYGNIISVRSTVGHNLKYWRKKKIQNCISSKKKLGGGVLNELSHEINYLVELFGELKLVNSKKYKSFFKNFDVEDSAYILFKNKDDIIINLIMDFYRQDKFRECQIICEKATIFVDFINGKIYLAKNKVKTTLYKNKKHLEISYYNQWLYLKKIINEDLNFERPYNSLITTKIINGIK